MSDVNHSNNNIGERRRKDDQKELQRVQEDQAEEVDSLELRIQQLRDQNARLKDQVKEAQENGRKYYDEFIKSQEKFSEFEDWNVKNQSMTNNIIKKLQEEKEGLDKELQSMKKDLANLNLLNGNEDYVDEEIREELRQSKQELQASQANCNLLQEENKSLKNELLAIERKLWTMRTEWDPDNMGEDTAGRTGSGNGAQILPQLDGIRDQLQISREICSGLENEVKIYKEKLDACNDELTVKNNHLGELKGRVEYVDLPTEAGLERKKSRAEKNNLEAECQRFKVRIRELERNVNDLKKEKLNLSNGQSKSVETPTYSQDQTLELLPGGSYIHQMNQDLESELSTANRKLAHTESDLWRSQSQVDELTEQLKQSLDKIAEFESCSSNIGLVERSEYSAQVQQVKRQVHDLRFALQRKEKESSDLETRLKETREEMHKMEVQLNMYDKQRWQLQDDLKREREEFLKLQEEHASFQRDTSENKTSEDFYKRELASRDSLIAEQKVNAANMELKYHELCERNAMADELLEKYKKENREIEDDLLQTHTDMADMQVEVKVAENEKEDLNAQLQVAYKTISDLKSRCQLAEQGVKEKEHEISLTTQRLTRMEDDLEEASKVKSSLEFQIYEYNSNARRKEDVDNTIQGQIEEYQRTCEGLRQQVAEKELVIERLKDKVSSLETDVRTLKADVSYKESLNETNEEELKRLALKLKNSEEEVARLKERYEAVFKEKGTLQIDLSVAHKKVEAIESSLKENSEKENVLVKTLQEERSRFIYKETDVVSYRSQISALELQSEVQTKEKVELRSKVDELEEKSNVLKFQLEETASSRDQEIRRRMELEEKKLEIQKDLQEAGKTRSQREEELQDLWNRVAKYEVQIEALKRQNEELKEQAVEANIQVVNQREEKMKLEIVATEHQKMRESSQYTLQQKEKDHGEMQNVVKALQTELTKVKNELITSKVSHECSLDENNRLCRKIQEQDSKLELFEKELSDAKEENRQVNVGLGCQTAKVNSLQLQLGSALRERERFREDFKIAEDKVQRIQEEMLSAHNQVREKERIVESYRSEMGEKDTYIGTLKSSKDVLEEKILALKKELQTTSFYCESNEAKLKEAQEEISTLRVKLGQYDTTVNTLLKERDEKDKHHGDPAHQKHLEMLLDQSKEKQASLEREIEKNKSKVMKLEQDLKSSRQDCLDSQFENSKSQRLFEDLKVTHELGDKERRALREEVLEVNRKISDLELKYENEQRDNMALQSQLQDATNRGETNRNEILKLSKQSVELKVLVEAANKEIGEKNRQISELKATKGYLEEKSVELGGHLTSTVSECEKLRGGNQQLQDEIISQQRSLSNLKDRLQKVQKNEQTIQKELTLKTSEMESFKTELAESAQEKEELKGKERRMDDSLTKLREEQVVAGERIAEQSDKLKTFGKELAGKENEIATLKERNVSLKSELDEIKATLTKTKDELASVQEKKERNNSFKARAVSFEVESEGSDDEEVYVIKEYLKEVEQSLQKSIANEDTLRDQIASLNEANASLENSVHALEGNETLLHKRCEESQKELEGTKMELTRAKEAVNKTGDQLEVMQDKVLQLEAHLDRMEAAKCILEEEVNVERDKLGKAEDELLKVHCKLQGLQTKWDHTVKEALGNDSVLDTVKSEKRYLEKDIQTLREELSSAHTLMNTTLKRNRELDQENFQLKKTTADYETREAILRQENEELSKSIANLQNTIAELQLGIQQKLKANGSLKDELEIVRKHLSETKNEYDKVMKDLSQFKGGVKDFKKVMSEKDNSLHHLENTKRSLEEDLAELRKQLSKGKEVEENIQKEATKLHAVIQGKENKILEFEHGISKSKERNRKLQSDIVELKKNASAQMNELQNAQKEIKKLTNEIHSQGPVISNLQAKNRALDEEKQKLKEELQKLKWQCSEQRIQMDALQHENERLRGKLNDAQVPKSPTRLPQVNKNKVEPDLSNHRKLIELETAYQDSLLEKEDAVNKITSLQENIKELAQENDHYLWVKDALEKEISWKNTRIHELEESLQKAEDSLKLDRNEFDALSESKAEIESELNSTRDTVLGLEECSSTYEEMIRHLEEKQVEIQQTNSQLQKSQENSEFKLNLQKQELAEALRKVSELESSSQSNASNNNELVRDLQASKSKVALLEDELCASAREQAKTSVILKDVRQQNDKLRKDLVQLKSKLMDEQHDRESDGKEIREKSDLIRRLQADNRELENEISVLSKEVNGKTTEYLTLMSQQEESQEELQELRNQITEFKSSWMQEKSDNEKLRLETATTRKLHEDLKVMYDNLLDEVDNYRDQSEDNEFSKSAEVQRTIMEKEHLTKELQVLNKRLAMLKENYEKSQQEKKELEKKLKIMQQRLLVLEADEKTTDTITALQRELEESKQKILDVTTMYEAIRSERDTLRTETVSRPTTPKAFIRHEANLTGTSPYFDTFSPRKKVDESSIKQEMFETQARAMLLEQKLKIARERLEGLKAAAPPLTEDSVDNTEAVLDEEEN